MSILVEIIDAQISEIERLRNLNRKLSERFTINEEIINLAKLEISRIRADEVGGCFRPENIPQGGCVDGVCYCNRQAEIEAKAVLNMVLQFFNDKKEEIE